MKINHNMSAVNVNNQMKRTEDALSTAIERLSSGLRINSAEDDAAGMAISNKMQAQIDGLDQASRNASDGTSLMRTADGALGEVVSMIQRMRELSVQAANGTNSDDDREAIQMEVDSLLEEIDRISTDTEFNTKTLFDGSLERRTYANTSAVTNIQVSDDVSADFYTVTVEKEGTSAIAQGDAVTTTAADIVAGIITINDVSISVKDGESASSVYEKLRDAGEKAGVDVYAVDASGNKVPFSYDGSCQLVFETEKSGSSQSVEILCDSEDLVTALGLANVVSDWNFTAVEGTNGSATAASGITASGSIKITVDDNTYTMSITVGASEQDIQDALEAAAKDLGVQIFAVDPNGTGSDATGGYATAAYSYGCQIVVLADAGSEVDIQYDNASLAAELGLDNTKENDIGRLIHIGTDAEITFSSSNFGSQVTYSADGNDITITDRGGFSIYFEAVQGITDGGSKDVVLEVTDIGMLTLQVGANEGQVINCSIPEVSTISLKIEDLDVTKSGGPEDAIVALDWALMKVSSIRSKIGAYENRLDYSVSDLDQFSENMTAALSRIQDVDMAEEMTEYTKQTVLSQASVSVLAQANDMPQQVLQLLQ